MARRRNRKQDDDPLFDEDAPGSEPRRVVAAEIRGNNTLSVDLAPGTTAPVALHQAAQDRYLNYALSVITSRALPDVRDGLKPVHRRILYTMWQQRLTADAKHRKSAKVVGDVMGNYHPHGDSAIYDALVRMAQPFSLRVPLIDGSGNFGSLDGDPAAAMRYTECRLTPIATELLDDIGRDTVPFRPNYDGTRTEPVVLPAKLPNLLVNGSSGIAVGMATNIPPHNPGEVCNALLKLLNDLELKTYQLVANDAIKGPDFPTGGQVITPREELREIYRTGSGTIRLRGTVEPGEPAKGRSATRTLIITSIPYGINKSTLVEQIGGLVENRKLAQLVDVTDLSTDDVRIHLEIKKDADEQKVLAYLYKNTLLQHNFSMNLTCLLPTENPDVGRPQRSDLHEVLWHFLHFRLQVVTRRLEHELAALERRLHLLEGFAFAFDVLDEIIAIIRKSDGKADAAAKILATFGIEPHGPRPTKRGKNNGLDPEQVDAILELKLYRLARLEINLITDELKQRRDRRAEIQKLLAEPTDNPQKSGRWAIVREEIEQLRDTYGKPDKRRTIIEAVEDEPEFSEEDFIVAEDNHVLVTADGWVKRQKEINPETTRLREGDRILALEPGSTKATIVFFSNYGVAYTARILDIPATTGYGEPIQKLFKLNDGERILAAKSLDPRSIGPIEPDANHPDDPPPVHGVAVTGDGYGLRFSIAGFAEVSTRTGRKFARPAKGVEVLRVEAIDGSEHLLVASRQARALVCAVSEINFLAGPGKGVQVIKLAKGDALLGAKTATDDRDTLTCKTSMGGEQRINTAKYQPVSRGGKGHEVIKRGKLVEVVTDEVVKPIELEA